MKTLSQFLEGAKQQHLSPEDRKLLVDQAIVVLQDYYVHLSFKRAMHGVDPVRRLQLLKAQLGELPPDNDIPFHREMVAIFEGVRDLHTNYLLPQPFHLSVAFLPIQVEECWKDGSRAWIVSRLVDEASDVLRNASPDAKAGAEFLSERVKAVQRDHEKIVGGEILAWNGVPIANAVDILAERCPGGNAEARHAQAVSRLTLRPMIRALPPDEHWVSIEYRGTDGERHTLWTEWLVFEPADYLGIEAPQTFEPMPTGWSLGVDVEGDFARQSRLTLARPDKVKADQERYLSKETLDPEQTLLPTIFDDLKYFERAEDHSRYAYLRVRSFMAVNPDAMVQEFARLLRVIPTESSGLIIDVRGNTGGFIAAGERMLQLISPRVIEPERFQMIVTDRTRNIAAGEAYGQWAESIRRGITTGASFSAAFPISPKDICNNIGQLYYRPVVLIVDGLCYSATDMFIAGFADHRIGPVVGVDRRTGAGGAAVKTQSELQSVFKDNGGGDSGLATISETDKFEKGGLRVAFLRALRVGANFGVELEDFGVQLKDDAVYPMTFDDVRGSNEGLKQFATAKLRGDGKDKSEKVEFAVDVRSDQNEDIVLDFSSANTVDRVDVFVDGRPVASFGGRQREKLKGPWRQTVTQIRLQAYRESSGGPIEASGDEPGWRLVANRSLLRVDDTPFFGLNLIAVRNEIRAKAKPGYRLGAPSR